MVKENSGSEPDGWSKISIRKKMKEEVDDFVNTDEAKKHGLTNSTQFIDISVREALEKYTKKRIDHFNFHDNIIRLIDNDLPKGRTIVEIYLKKQQLICTKCEVKDCIHIAACWEDPDIKKQLMLKEIKSSFDLES